MQFEGPNTASYSPSSTLVESLASFLRWGVGLECVAGGFCQYLTEAEGLDCTALAEACITVKLCSLWQASESCRGR